MRTQENKGAAGPATADEIDHALARLERELDALLVFLKAYDGSRHPARFEALRWQIPRLAGHDCAIRALLASLELEARPEPPRR